MDWAKAVSRTQKNRAGQQAGPVRDSITAFAADAAGFFEQSVSLVEAEALTEHTTEAPKD